MKFPRSRRITRRAEFARVRGQGKNVTGRFLVMGYLKDEALGGNVKLGLITTKKIGNAVVRNRVRRRLRAIFQRNVEKVQPGYWMVLVARNAAGKATSDQLEKEWKWMLDKASIAREEKEKEKEAGC